MSKPSTRPGTNRKHHISSSCPFHQHVSMLCSLCHLWHPSYIPMLSKNISVIMIIDIYCSGWSIGKPSYMWSWGYIIDIYIYMMIHWETSMIMITYMVSQCLHMEVSPNRATMYYPTSKAWMIRGTRSSDNSHWVTSTCGEKSEKSTAGSVLAVFFCHFLNQQPWLMVDDECSTMVVDDI